MRLATLRSAALARAVLIGVVLISVGGCSQAPWKAPEPGRSAHSASPTPSTSVSATADRNDLSKGSAARTLKTGDVSVAVKYWSSLPVEQWTADVVKPLNVSVSATMDDKSKKKIYLSKVTVYPTIEGADEAGDPPPPLVDEATVKPGYVITSPYSYGQLFAVPPLAAGTTRLMLTINYEILVQTTPTSKSYAKQAASDVLMIAITP